MTLPPRSLVRFIPALFAVTLSGCTGELKKENAELKAQSETLTKAKASLEVELAKKSVELDGLKERLAEAKKREEEQSLKLTTQQGDAERLKGELQIAKDRFAALGKDIEAAQTKLANFVREQAEKHNKPTIDFQASVTFKSGDTKPIANTRFYFLNRSLFGLIRETKAVGFLDKAEGTYRGIAYSLATGIDSKDSTKNIPELRDAIAKAVVLSFTTNMNGTASPELPPGNYWVFGVTKLGDDPILWDLETTISGGKNQILLSNANFNYPY